MAESGESIELPVTLLNNGYGEAHNVEAILSTIDSDITVTDSDLTFGTISAGAIVRVEDFIFDISSACTEKDVLFNLDITSDEDTWRDTFSVHIYRQDPCNNVINIDGTGAVYAQTFTSGGTGSWNVNCFGIESPGLEQVYSLVAPETGTYNIEVTDASSYFIYAYQASSCSESGWTCLEDIGQSGTYGELNWTAGTTYYILLGDETLTTDTHRFYITNPGEPNIEYYDHDIDDDDKPPSSGDNDDLPEAGESIQFPVTLYNSGTAAAQNIVAQISTSDTDIIVTDGGFDFYGTIPAGEAVQSEYFTFDISSACPEKDVMFNLDITSDGGGWTDTFSVHIYPPDPCDNIIAINGCGGGYTQSFAGGGSSSWNITSCGSYTPGKEQIYSFKAPETDEYFIVVTTASGIVDYFWQSASCGATEWNCIDDINSAGSFGSMSLTADTTYYFLLDDEDFVAGNHQFYIDYVHVGLFDEELSDNMISIYPNPAQDHLFISASNDIKGELLITIKDVLGRTRYSGKIEELNTKEEYSLNISSFEYGVYFIRLQSKEFDKVFRFVKY
jgi:tellurite resistance-related uncharacterized protein